jgi:hypothetical protein
LIVREKAARIAQNSAARVKHGRIPGRSIRAVKAATKPLVIVRVVRTRMTARSSPSARHSAGVALIATASSTPTSASRAPSRSRRRPASASPS